MQEDNMGIQFQPAFKTVTFADGNTGNAIELDLFPHDLDAFAAEDAEVEDTPVTEHEIQQQGMAAVAPLEVNRMLNMEQHQQ
jgi:hypothetical protein